MSYVLVSFDCFSFYVFFFFKQKTAYEMRISDWSSDVCSSDLEQVDWHSEPEHKIGEKRSDDALFGMLTAVLVKAADRPAQRRLGVCGLEPSFLRERLLDADEVGWRGIGGRKQVGDRVRGVGDEAVDQNIDGACDGGLGGDGHRQG